MSLSDKTIIGKYFGPLAMLCSVAGSLAAIQVFTIAASVFHFNITASLSRLILVFSIFTGALLWFFAHKNESKTDPGPKASPIDIAVISSCAAVYVFLWFFAIRVPDLSCDGNAYHIPAIGLWSQAGRISWIDLNFKDSSYMNGYPKGVEVAAFILVKAFNSSSLVNTANLLYLPLGVFGIWLGAVSLGVSRTRALTYASLFVLVPVNVTQSITTYVDSAFASCACAFLALCVYSFCAAKDGKTAVIASICAGICAGLALGAKSTGTALMVLTLVVSGGWVLAYSIGLPKSERRHRFAACIKSAALIIVFAIIVGAFWYARNIYYRSSPLYPAGVSVAGIEIFPGKAVDQLLNPAANMPQIMQPWPGYLRVLAAWSQFFWSWPNTIWCSDSRYGGLGFLWILACVPAGAIVLAGVRKFSTEKHLGLLMLAGSSAALFFITPMNWWPRYTLWLYAIGLPCLAGAVEKIPREWLKNTVIALVTAIALSEALTAIYLQPAMEFLKGDPLLTASANQPNPMPQSIPFSKLRGTVFDEIFDSNDSVAIGTLRSQADEKRWKVELVSRFLMPIDKRRICALSTHAKRTPDQLRADGIKWIIWDANAPLPAQFESLERIVETNYGLFVMRL